MAKSKAYVDPADDSIDFSDIAPVEEAVGANEAVTNEPWAHVLNAPYANKFTRGPSFKLSSVPAPLRMLVEQSLQDYWEEELPKFRDVPCGQAGDTDEEAAGRAKEFMTHVRRYARNRPDGRISTRMYPLKDQPGVVHFAALPYTPRAAKATAGTDNAFDELGD